MGDVKVRTPTSARSGIGTCEHLITATVSMDYADIGDEGAGGAAMKLLVGKYRDIGHHFSHLVKCKGLGGERIVDKVIEIIKEAGDAKLTLTIDGGLALVQVEERIVDKRGQATIPELPPAYDPSPMGRPNEQCRR